MKTFAEIIEKWGGRKVLAEDLGVEEELVRGWQRRGRIPDEWWKRLLAKAPKRGIKISPSLLIELAARD